MAYLNVALQRAMKERLNQVSSTKRRKRRWNHHSNVQSSSRFIFSPKSFCECFDQWGDAYIDPNAQNATNAVDRQGRDLGVQIYEAFFTSFDLARSPQAHKADVVLTVDLRAKILRTVTLYDVLRDVPRNRRDAEKRKWIGQRVMYNREKRGTWQLLL